MNIDVLKISFFVVLFVVLMIFSMLLVLTLFSMFYSYIFEKKTKIENLFKEYEKIVYQKMFDLEHDNTSGSKFGLFLKKFFYNFLFFLLMARYLIFTTIIFVFILLLVFMISK